MTFSTETIAQALHAAVRIKGGEYKYVNPISPDSGQCVYTTPTGAPSCIVGWVIAKTQPGALAVLNDYEYHTGSRPTSVDVQSLITGTNARLPRFDVDEVTAQALTAAQTIQDEGLTWADAMEAFDRIIAGEEDRYEVTESIRARHWASQYAHGDASDYSDLGYAGNIE